MAEGECTIQADEKREEREHESERIHEREASASELIRK